LEKEYNIDFSKIPFRTWFYEGQTFVSPEWKQQGKPYQINGAIKEEWLKSLPKKKTLSLIDRIKLWLNPLAIKEMAKPESQNSFFENENLEETLEELDNQEKENEEEDLNGISEEWIK